MFYRETITPSNNDVQHLNIETQESSPIQENNPQSTINYGDYLGFIPPLALFALLLIFKIDFKEYIQNKIYAWKYFGKIPCYRCRFFKDNPYLKCAVHPSKVLTIKAVDCLDYQAKNNKRDKLSQL
jgi:hypothetical protein